MGVFGFIFPKDDALAYEPFKIIDYIFGLFVFYISFGVYLYTLTPTIGFHDSGELITCAWTLGIAHPPGYPLYTLFGKVWTTLIPIGNIAFRMNMESALFASLAVMMVYFITLKLTSKIIPSIVASLILAFSLTFWEQAVIAEKYTLNAFFFTLIIFILLKWQETRSQRLLYLFSFILGLSFCHHFQTIYLVPASIFFILATLLQEALKAQRKKLHRGHRFSQISSIFNFQSSIYNLSKMVLLFILSLTLWVYLPLRAGQDPVLNWGDPSNWENFIFHITGQHYIGYFSSIKESILRLLSYLNFFPSQFGYILLLIALVGVVLLIMKNMFMFFFLFLIFLSNTLSSLRYNILNIQDYYIPSFILVSILINYSLSFIIEVLSKFRLSFLKFLFLLLPFIPCSTHYFQNNRSLFYYAYDYGMNILRPLKKEAIIFSYGDSDNFPLSYLKMCEERKKDICNFVLTSLFCDWHIESIKKLHPKISLSFNNISYKEFIKSYDSRIVANERLNRIITFGFGKFPIYVGPGVAEEENGIRENFFLLPDGIFFRLLPQGIDKERLYEELENSPTMFLMKGKGIKDIVASKMLTNYEAVYNEKGNLYRQIYHFKKAIIEYKKGLNILPLSLSLKLNLAFAYLSENRYDEAKEEFNKIIEEDKNFEPSFVHYGMGLVYQNKGDFKKAIDEYNLALSFDPNNISVKQMLSETKKFLDKKQAK